MPGNYTTNGWFYKPAHDETYTEGGVAFNAALDAVDAQLQKSYNAMNRTVTPEDYGAVGNGIVDDTLALNAAITAAGVGGKIVLSNRYLLTDTITISDGVTISGNADGAMLLFDVDGIDCVYVAPNTERVYGPRVLLENFTIHTTSHIPSNLIVLGSETSSDKQVYAATLRNIACGYDLDLSTYPYVTGAVIFSRSTSYLVIDNCHIDQVYAGYGIRTQHSQDTTPATITCSIRNSVISNVLADTGYDGIGLQVDGCQGLWLYGCTVQACRGGGIYLNTADEQYARNFAMYGGHIEENTTYDIKTTEYDNTYNVGPAIFDSVQFFNSTGTVITLDGSYYMKHFNHCTFNNNVTITGCGQSLLKIDDCMGGVTATNGYIKSTVENVGP